MITCNQIRVGPKGGQQMSVSSKQQPCTRHPGSSLLVLFISAASCLGLPSCLKHADYETLLVEKPAESSAAPSDSSVTGGFLVREANVAQLYLFQTNFETVNCTSCCLF